MFERRKGFTGGVHTRTLLSGGFQTARIALRKNQTVLIDALDAFLV